MATIKVTKNELKEYIAEALKHVLHESKIEYAISFETLNGVLEESGWHLTNVFEASLHTGERGMKYEMAPYRKDALSSSELHDEILKRAKYPNAMKFYDGAYSRRCAVFAMSVKQNKDKSDILPSIKKDINNGEYDELIQNNLKSGESLDKIAYEICKNTDGIERVNNYLISRTKKLIQGRIGERDKNQLELNLM